MTEIGLLDMWNHVKLQLPTVQDNEDEVYKRTIQACPANQAGLGASTLGRYHCVLVANSNRAMTVGADGQYLASLVLVL